MPASSPYPYPAVVFLHISCWFFFACLFFTCQSFLPPLLSFIASPFLELLGPHFCPSCVSYKVAIGRGLGGGRCWGTGRADAPCRPPCLVSWRLSETFETSFHLEKFLFWRLSFDCNCFCDIKYSVPFLPAFPFFGLHLPGAARLAQAPVLCLFLSFSDTWVATDRVLRKGEACAHGTFLVSPFFVR